MGTSINLQLSGSKQMGACVEEVVSAAALALFRKHHKGEFYYSLPGSLLVMHGDPADEKMEVRFADASDPAISESEGEDGNDAAVKDMLAKRKVFFKVVNKMPARMKVDVSDGTPTKLQFQDIVVTLHRCCPLMDMSNTR